MIAPINIQPINNIDTHQGIQTPTPQAVATSTESKISDHVVLTSSQSEGSNSRNDDSLLSNNKTSATHQSKQALPSLIQPHVRVNVGYDNKTGVFVVALEDIKTKKVLEQLPSKNFISALESEIKHTA